MASSAEPGAAPEPPDPAFVTAHLSSLKKNFEKKINALKQKSKVLKMKFIEKTEILEETEVRWRKSLERRNKAEIEFEREKVELRMLEKELDELERKLRDARRTESKRKLQEFEKKLNDGFDGDGGLDWFMTEIQIRTKVGEGERLREVLEKVKNSIAAGYEDGNGVDVHDGVE